MTVPALAEVVLVHGTHGFDPRPRGRRWWQGGPFVEMLRRNGIIVADELDPFAWCGAVDGIFGASPHWIAAGLALRWRLKALGRPVALVVHSHGLAPALVALSSCLTDREPVQVRALISVCSPVRDELDEAALEARENCGVWIQIHSSRGDFWQITGGIGDGDLELRPDLDHPRAHLNIAFPAIDHTRILEEPAAIAKWEAEPILCAALRDGAAVLSA